MEKGKMIDLVQMKFFTITKMEQTEKGYRLEVQETGKYYCTKPNPTMDEFYKTHVATGRKIEVTMAQPDDASLNGKDFVRTK